MLKLGLTKEEQKKREQKALLIKEIFTKKAKLERSVSKSTFRSDEFSDFVEQLVDMLSDDRKEMHSNVFLISIYLAFLVDGFVPVKKSELLNDSRLLRKMKKDLQILAERYCLRQFRVSRSVDTDLTKAAELVSKSCEFIEERAAQFNKNSHTDRDSAISSLFGLYSKLLGNRSIQIKPIIPDIFFRDVKDSYKATPEKMVANTAAAFGITLSEKTVQDRVKAFKAD